jgi:hypothetical protein
MLPNANKWKRNGKVWFEKEINYQIEPDGTYLQDSMNYHRVVIQLLTWGIALAEINGEWFQSCVYEKAYKSLNFLYQCQDEPTGWLPNYGANDGALFFPLSTSDFRDYRPQLDALHQILTGTPLYDTSFEDAQWIVDKGIKHYSFSPLKRQFGIVKFDVSGFYIIREKQALTFVRCGNFKKKGTTDQLHIDVWYRGKNILFDCGSYKYNTEYYLKKYFGGTESHNTVMLDDSDQMLKGPRFMWFYPHHTRKVSAVETNETYTLIGEIEVFRQLGNNIIVSRTIQKNKSKDEWIVTDKIKNKPQQMIFRQLWHTIDDEVNFESSGSLVKKKKFVSNYYGTISTCDQIEFDSENNIIITHISLK